LMDSEDGILGEEPRMLAGASSIGVYEVAALVASYGGVAFPAHIDRPSFSLISNQGLWDDGLGFLLAEVSPRCPPGFMSRRDLAGVPAITASDAHYLNWVLNANQQLDLPSRTTDALLD
ncbi:MAG: histidinol-phosphatase, partial [Pseudoflavonifractor sp.]